MRRRRVITLLGGAAAWPLVARAQPSGKTYRIGFLGPGSYAERKRGIDALRMGLRRLGYEEGRNIVIEYRWAEGRYDRLPELTAPAGVASKSTAVMIAILIMAFDLDPLDPRGSTPKSPHDVSE